MQFSGYSMVSRELSSGIRISKKPSALRNVRMQELRERKKRQGGDCRPER
jgi:hypothetical protein